MAASREMLRLVERAVERTDCFLTLVFADFAVADGTVSLELYGTVGCNFLAVLC